MIAEPVAPLRSIAGRRAVIATKHGKERALLPVLRDRLGVFVEVLQLDTDRFGTFTGEIERSGSQLDALHAKLRAAAEETPYDALFIASEGAFFPNPAAPLLTLNRELVGLYERESGTTIVGSALSYAPVALHARVSSMPELRDVLATAHLPSHAVVVRTSQGIVGGLRDAGAIESVARNAIVNGETIAVESDLRAHMNATRMQTIVRACANLTERISKRCRRCAAPNFWPDRTEPGLLCAACGEPTGTAATFIARCEGCGFEERRDVVGPGNPAYCPSCNP